MVPGEPIIVQTEVEVQRPAGQLGSVAITITWCPCCVFYTTINGRAWTQTGQNTLAAMVLHVFNEHADEPYPSVPNYRRTGSVGAILSKIEHEAEMGTVIRTNEVVAV